MASNISGNTRSLTMILQEKQHKLQSLETQKNAIQAKASLTLKDLVVVLQQVHTIQMFQLDTQKMPTVL